MRARTAKPCSRVSTSDDGYTAKDISIAGEGVERRESGFHIAGSCVPIDRAIWQYRNGEDPEAIRSQYPTLTLEELNEAIAFYQRQREEVDQTMEERRRAEDAYTAANPNSAEVKEEFERMRLQIAPWRI